MGNSLNGAQTDKRTETVAMSRFFSHPSILVRVQVKRERGDLNLDSLDSSFDSIYEGAAKALSALTKRGSFLGTVRKVFFLKRAYTFDHFRLIFA